MPALVRPRNDLGQYDDLAAEWWKPRGSFAMLHWIAAARAELIPPAPRPGTVLADLGCGGGLMAPHARRLGYEHVGVDLTTTALLQARARGVRPVRGDVTRLPLADATAEVVVAGEILEHVADPVRVVQEAARVLRPGGRLVLDTIADTWLARLLVVELAERIPGLAPPGIHDPSLFVDPARLVRAAGEAGIPLRLRGIRLEVGSAVRWLLGRAPAARLVPTRSLAVLFQGCGVKTA